MIVAFDKQGEEAKVHDPYLGQKHIKDMHAEKESEAEKEGSEGNVASLAFFSDKALEN